MTKEQDKLGEAIGFFNDITDETYLERDNRDLGDTAANMQEILKAASTYHRLKPLLEEMIDARKDATKGEWKLIWEAGRRGIISIEAGGKFFARDIQGSDNADNIERVANAKLMRTSANNITKIQEIIQEGAA